MNLQRHQASMGESNNLSKKIMEPKSGHNLAYFKTNLFFSQTPPLNDAFLDRLKISGYSFAFGGFGFEDLVFCFDGFANNTWIVLQRAGLFNYTIFPTQTIIK